MNVSQISTCCMPFWPLDEWTKYVHYSAQSVITGIISDAFLHTGAVKLEY